MMKNAAEFETEQDDVFGRISARYDLLCDLFSFGIHRSWKQRVANVIWQEPWIKLLDVASGTGDIVQRILDNKQFSPDHEIIVSDLSPKMLTIAEGKLKNYSEYISYQILDAHSIASIEASSMDVYSMSLGLKICDREKAMTEAYRVLRPGGRLVILESSNIPLSWLHISYLIYMSVCMPIIGWIATNGDSSAYKYLLHGIRGFPKAEELKEELQNIGFTDVAFERLSLGVVAIHTGRKPE